MINTDLQRQIIRDHYKYPQNKIENIENVENYQSQLGLNPSCGDEVTVYILVEDQIIKDIKFNGSGCSICCASASVMTTELIGKTIEEVEQKIADFSKLLKGDEDVLEHFEDAIAFCGIKDFPARYKCAAISWDTVKLLLNKEINE